MSGMLQEQFPVLTRIPSSADEAEPEIPSAIDTCRMQR